MVTLFLAWQDQNSRRWFPIGKLWRRDDLYYFEYVSGVREAQRIGNFQPLPSFPQLEQRYRSEELFSLFANRIMPFSRPDFADYARWLHLEENSKDRLAYLGASGGRRETDTLEVFPDAQPNALGNLTVQFFLHGIRHLSSSGILRAERLLPGDILKAQWDAQNEYDASAVTLITCSRPSGDADIVGYLPRYLTHDVMASLRRERFACSVQVIQVNQTPAPIQFRVLCQIEFTKESGVVPFRSPEYDPLTVADVILQPA